MANPIITCGPFRAPEIKVCRTSTRDAENTTVSARQDCYAGSGEGAGRKNRVGAALTGLVTAGLLFSSSVMAQPVSPHEMAAADRQPACELVIPAGESVQLESAAILAASPGGAPACSPRFYQRGTASWYGPGFHHHLTANGEYYNMNGISAAHPTLPFNTMIRVKNLNNGRTLDMRVNDRGPYWGGRVLDVSRGAAGKLGMLDSGTAPVEIGILECR